MARPNKPWYRASRNEWCVTIDGKTHRLGPDEDAAQRKFHLLMADRPKPAPVVPPAEDYLHPLFQSYLDWLAKQYVPSTVQTALRHCNNFLAMWPTIRLSEVRHSHLQALLDARSWASSTKALAVQRIRAAVRWAASERQVADPLAGFKTPASKPRATYVTPADFDEILAQVTEPCFRDYLTVAYDLGARPQEMRIIAARHVDLARQVIVIPAAEAKGHRTRPIVISTDRSLEIVRRRVEQFPDGPIFRTPRGLPWAKNRTGKRFLALEKKLGRKYCMYELRHGWFTRALESGLESHTVARLGGHSSTRMIDHVYSHVGENVDYMLAQAKRIKK